MRPIPLAISLACLILASCAGLTPQGLSQALRFDPLAADPGAIQIAASLPESITLSEGGVTIGIALAEAGTDLVSERVALDVTEVLVLPNDVRAGAGMRLWRARFDEEGAARFRAAQAEIARLRADGTEGVGTLAIMVGEGCHTGPLPAEMPFRTWLSTAPGAAFIPFTRQGDLFMTLPPEQVTALRAQLTPCP